MNKKLKAKLITALKKAGMGEGHAALLEGKTEAEILAFINDLPDGPEEETLTADELAESDVLLEAVEKMGFDKLLSKSKEIQRQHDKKVTAGITTFKKNLLGDESDKKKKPKEMDDEKLDGAPDWFKGFAESVNSRLSNFEKATKESTVQKSAKDLLSKTKLPKKLQEKWVNRIQLESEISIEDQVKELEEEYKEMYVEIAGNDTYEFSDKGKKKKDGDLSASDQKELAAMAQTI